MKNKGRYGLHFANIELTDYCNLRCKHCYGNFTSSKIMTEKEVNTSIKQLLEAGCWSVTLTGGEPLILGDKLFIYAKKFRKFFERLIITTNGMLIDKFDPGKFKIFDMIQISIDGPAKVHNSIRGNNVFEKTVKNLLFLKKRNINVSVMMTLNRENYEYFFETYKIFKSYGIKMFYERYTPVYNKELKLLPDQYEAILKIAKKNDIRSSDPILRSYLLKDDVSYKRDCGKITGGCSAGISGVAISSDLDVFPCVRMRRILGNLKKNDLLYIWFNNDILDLLRDVSLLKGKCHSCVFVGNCRGCRADALLDGDMLQEDKLCPIYRPKTGRR